MKNKLCSLVLALIASAVCFTTAVRVSDKALAMDSQDMAQASVMADGAKELTKLLAQAVWNGDTSVVVNYSNYGLTFEEFDRVLAELSLIPKTFAADSYNYSGWDTSYIVYPRYYQEIYDDYDAAKELFTSTIQKIAGLAASYGSDLEKILFVNDYLCENYNYDYSYSRHDPYSMFRDGVGVCQAFTRAFTAVMDELGIESTFVRSDSMNHVWNIVRVEGKWYHIDVTWNENQTRSLPGTAAHKYFLTSTEWLKSSEAGHLEENDWVYGEDVQCGNTDYDEYFWRSSKSHFIKSDEYWYFVDEDGLGRWNGSSGTFIRLAEFSEIFKDSYPGVTLNGALCDYSGLVSAGGSLYFNGSFNVVRYNINSGTTESLVDTLFDSMSVMTLWLDGADVVYRVHGSSGYEDRTIPLTETIRVAEGHYGYSKMDDELTIHADEGATVIAVCLDVDGRMTTYKIINAVSDGVILLDGQSVQTVRLISVSAAYSPICRTVDVSAA